MSIVVEGGNPERWKRGEETQYLQRDDTSQSNPARGREGIPPLGWEEEEGELVTVFFVRRE